MEEDEIDLLKLQVITG